MSKTPKSSTPAPRLLCFAGLWGITELPQYKNMSRIDTMKFAKKAGFEGVMVGADGEMIRETHELGLERMSGISCGASHRAWLSFGISTRPFKLTTLNFPDRLFTFDKNHPEFILE